MLRILFLFTLFVIASEPSRQSARAQGIEVIPSTGQWVTDRGEMLTDREERALSQKLAAYEDTTSTQIVIVTLQTLDGVPAADYAIELGRQWGVGQSGQDNGVVILASRVDRKLFIATGYGLEGAIPDIIANRIVEDVVVPNFRQGRFYDGFSLATDALIAAARGEYRAPPGSGSGGGGINVGLIQTLFWIAVIIFVLTSRRGGGGGGRRYKGRGGFPVILWGPSFGGGNYGGGGFGGSGGFGGGGFGGGGGSFGGGGAGGSW